MLFETVLLLAAVCLLAYVVIRFLHRRLYGPRGNGLAGHGRLEVVDRLVVGPRRSIQVVRAGSKVLLIGVSDNQISLIDELNSEDWPAEGSDETTNAVRGAFKKTLRDVLAGKGEQPSDSSEAETEGRSS